MRGFLSDEYKGGEIDSFYLSGCFEVGEKEKYEEIISTKIRHRFFNKVEIKGDKVYKTCIVPEYEDVHQNEKDWYKFVDGRFDRTPKLYSTNPLIMQKIDGRHAWDIDEDKSIIIDNYCDILHDLHTVGFSQGSMGECMNVYFTKAWNRVEEVAPILRYLNEPAININGVCCQNPMYNLSVLEDAMSGIVYDIYYNVIHGDPSFSNSLVDKDNKVWLIDPRGSFGNTKIFGDRRYDWAKFYYSAVGNYDSMNSKKFKVTIKDIPDVELEIASNGYEEYGDIILQRSGMSKREMDLIHANLWLSLTGYVKEDVEAALFSFFMGTYIWSTRAIT